MEIVENSFIMVQKTFDGFLKNKKLLNTSGENKKNVNKFIKKIIDQIFGYKKAT